MVEGVCAGLAEYFEIDASFVRIIWALSILFAGCGIFIYIIAAIIIPNKPKEKVKKEV